MAGRKTGMRSDPIQRYILKSHHNLRIAAAVGDAWLETRQALVSSFLDQLDIRLSYNQKVWK